MNKTILGVLAVAAALSFAQGETKKSTILVVDLQGCVDECEESKVSLQALEQERKQKEEAVQLQVRDLKAKQEELQVKKLSERDEKWYTEFLALLQQKGEIEAQGNQFAARISDRIARLLEGLLLDARGFAEQIRTERGAEIVLVSKLGPIKLEDKKQVSDEYIVRRVIAYAPEMDITAEVVKRMNAKFKGR